MPVVVVGRGSNVRTVNPSANTVNVPEAMRVGATVGGTAYAHLLHDRQDALLLPSAHPPTAIQVLLLLQTFQRL
jgi:hypothetical protein